jgi:hypothetical protein
VKKQKQTIRPAEICRLMLAWAICLEDSNAEPDGSVKDEAILHEIAAIKEGIRIIRTAARQKREMLFALELAKKISPMEERFNEGLDQR